MTVKELDRERSGPSMDDNDYQSRPSPDRRRTNAPYNTNITQTSGSKTDIHGFEKELKLKNPNVRYSQNQSKTRSTNKYTSKNSAEAYEVKERDSEYNPSSIPTISPKKQSWTKA